MMFDVSMLVPFVVLLCNDYRWDLTNLNNLPKSLLDDFWILKSYVRFKKNLTITHYCMEISADLAPGSSRGGPSHDGTG